MNSFLSQNPIDESLVKNAFDFIEQRRFSTAFLILNELKSVGRERADILFALGTCLFSAGEYNSSAEYFEQSLVALKHMNQAGSMAPKTETYRNIRRNEIAENIYLKPFNLHFASLFFQITKENIILSIAKSYMKNKNTDKAKTFINSLNGDEFCDIKDQINKMS